MKKTIDWYAKWLATATLIVGTVVNSLGYYPAGPLILIAGGLIWLYVACLWREPAMIATNAMMVLAGVVGIVYAYASGMI
jgi:hypothetical protein